MKRRIHQKNTRTRDGEGNGIGNGNGNSYSNGIGNGNGYGNGYGNGIINGVGNGNGKGNSNGNGYSNGNGNGNGISNGVGTIGLEMENIWNPSAPVAICPLYPTLDINVDIIVARVSDIKTTRSIQDRYSGGRYANGNVI